MAGLGPLNVNIHRPTDGSIMPGSPSRTAALPAPEIDAILTTYREPSRSVALALRSLILGADARVEEGVKWKSPSYHLDGVHFATYHVRPGRPLRLILHRDAKRRPDEGRLEVPDAAGLLAWRDHDRADVTFADVSAVEGVQASLRETIRVWVERL